MTNGGFDHESRVRIRFEATVENEIKHLWRQVELLWISNTKRTSEIEAARREAETELAAMEKELRGEVMAIKRNIVGAIVAYGSAAAGLAFLLLKPKLGL